MAENKNRKYEFKTLKVRPLTYKRIVKCKSRIEAGNGELVSFDKVLNNLIDSVEAKTE